VQATLLNQAPDGGRVRLEQRHRSARAAYDRLAYSHKREHVLAIESAKKPETRTRRIEKAIAMLRDSD